LKTVISKPKASPTVVFSDHFTHKCASCDGNAKSSKRDFSDQAWAALVAWSEVSPSAVDAPICNDCYFNFRDVLIERADELRLVAANVAANAKSTPTRRMSAKVARA